MFSEQNGHYKTSRIVLRSPQRKSRLTKKWRMAKTVVSTAQSKTWQSHKLQGKLNNDGFLFKVEVSIGWQERSVIKHGNTLS